MLDRSLVSCEANFAPSSEASSRCWKQDAGPGGPLAPSRSRVSLVPLPAPAQSSHLERAPALGMTAMFLPLEDLRAFRLHDSAERPALLVHFGPEVWHNTRLIYI